MFSRFFHLLFDEDEDKIAYLFGPNFGLVSYKKGKFLKNGLSLSLGGYFE